MRGISDDLSWEAISGRFNPAYAGNMFSARKMRVKLKVQPRVCGEYCRTLNSTMCRAGSTPRMRGICYSGLVYLLPTRFNPAYAGNMHAKLFPRFEQQVQPRVCGEYYRYEFRADSFQGSTPRMRGILQYCKAYTVRERFNPAYAGNMRRFHRNERAV